MIILIDKQGIYMKKRIITFIIVIVLFLTCVSCGSAEKYFIRSPYNEGSTQLFHAFDTIEAAKTCLKDVEQLGYVIYDSKGNVAYHPFDTLAQSRILYQAKTVADYVRTNGYTYGNASVNPAYDQGKTEKLVSCDRFVAWAIFLSGYSKAHYENSILSLYGEKNIENYLIANDFTRIDNIEEVQGGDVIFVGDSHEHYPNLQGFWMEYPDHVFICAGGSEFGNFYRYDAGSTRRITSVQPSKEPLEYPGKNFRFAYRAPAELP